MNSRVITFIASAAFLISHFAGAPDVALANDFHRGLRVVAVEGGQSPKLYYASPTGEVYFQWLPSTASGRWEEPAVHLGNFFGEQPVPGDFITGFHVVAEGPGHEPRFYFASSDGEIYHNTESLLRLNQTPGHLGNFFFGSPVPPDFQQGFRITIEGPGGSVIFYYASDVGDVYRQGSYFVDTPRYLGNFFGELPVPASQTTFGKIKALYRK